MSKQRVAGIDLRGTVEHPFGFVELYVGAGRSRRPAGRVGFGRHRDNPNPLGIWPTRDTPDNLHPLAIEEIRDTLKRCFPDHAEAADQFWGGTP